MVDNYLRVRSRDGVDWIWRGQNRKTLVRDNIAGREFDALRIGRFYVKASRTRRVPTNNELWAEIVGASG